jgi:hypothetical protein
MEPEDLRHDTSARFKGRHSGHEPASLDGMSESKIHRREALRRLVAGAVVGGIPVPLLGCGDEPQPPSSAEPGILPAAELAPPDPPSPEDLERLRAWTETLRRRGLAAPERPFGDAAVGVGELAIGTPYEAFTLEEYIRAGGSPMRTEPLTLSLTRFDCVSLVEACLAVARISHSAGAPAWEAFEREMERIRYRAGRRAGYTSRLHYFSEWLDDNSRRGLLQPLGQELGGVRDDRPLRFMSSNPDAYPALAYPEIREGIAAIERSLDATPRWVIPTARIPGVLDRLRSGDILGFATSIEGLDVTHAAFAYRDAGGVMRVLHAPLSGGVVEITRSTIPQYVAAIRRSTGILVARPLQG